MTLVAPSILTLNGGLSSIKFALYQLGEPPKRGLHGKVDRIGLSGTTFVFNDPARKQQGNKILGDADHRSAAMLLIDWLDKRVRLASIRAAGHRVVNGGRDYHEKHLVSDSETRNAMLMKTHGVYAPWIVVRADDKRSARLNVIRDIISRCEGNPPTN